MPTYHKLTFLTTDGNFSINASAQVGDIAYKVSSSANSTSVNGVQYSQSSPQVVGEISQIDKNNLYIKNMDVDNAPQAGDLIMFAKNKTVNKSGIKGYYAKIKLENNSDELVELFSIASEISPSSK